MPRPIKPKVSVVEVPTQPEPEIKPTPTADKPKRERKSKQADAVMPAEIKAAVDEIRKEEAPIIVERTARKGELTPEVEEALNKGDLKTWVGWAGEPGKLAAAAIKVMRAVPPLMEARFAHLGETLVFSRPVGTVASAEVVSADSGRVRVKTDDGRFSEVSPSAEVFVASAGSVRPKAMPTVHGRVLGADKDETRSEPKKAKTLSTSGRKTIFGHPATAIFRWCGAQGWTWGDAMATILHFGFGPNEVSESTAKIQVLAGKKGGDCGGRGPIPELTATEVEELRKAAGK